MLRFMFNIVIQPIILSMFYENVKQVYSISVKFGLFMFFLRSLQTQTGQMEDHAHHAHKARIRFENIFLKFDIFKRLCPPYPPCPPCPLGWNQNSKCFGTWHLWDRSWVFWNVYRLRIYHLLGRKYPIKKIFFPKYYILERNAFWNIFCSLTPRKI